VLVPRAAVGIDALVGAQRPGIHKGARASRAEPLVGGSGRELVRPGVVPLIDEDACSGDHHHDDRRRDDEGHAVAVSERRPLVGRWGRNRPATLGRAPTRTVTGLWRSTTGTSRSGQRNEDRLDALDVVHHGGPSV